MNKQCQDFALGGQPAQSSIFDLLKDICELCPPRAEN